MEKLTTWSSSQVRGFVKLLANFAFGLGESTQIDSHSSSFWRTGKENYLTNITANQHSKSNKQQLHLLSKQFEKSKTTPLL